MGVGISLCIPPFCYGMSTVSGGSANLGGTDMDSDFASVTEQSGIKAGDGGFDIRVGGNTDLKGAVIASSDKAVADGKNRLETASLTTSDIRNKAEYDASTFSIGGGYSEIGKDPDGKVQTGGNITPGTEIPTNENQIGASLPIAISASDSASSVTRSGISGGTILITDAAAQRERTGQSVDETLAGLNRDVSSDRDNTNALKPIFDEEQIRAGFEIVNAFANEAGTLLANKAKEVDAKRNAADAAEAKALETSDAELSQALRDQAIRLRNEADGVAGNWGAGGTYRQITTALVAAASGNISAGNGAFMQGMVVNYVQQQGAGYLGDLVADGTLVEGTPMHAALHGILACAGAAASSQSCGSGAAGAAASSLLTGLFSEASPTETESQREAKRNLIVSLVTGIAATTSLDAATATAAASGAVDNNWLATQQFVQARKELKEAEGRLDELKVLAKWAYISKKQDLLTQSGVGQGLIKAGFDDISGLTQMLLHPIDTVKAIGGLIDDPSALAGYPEEVKQNLKAKVARIENALTVGGDANAEQMGYDIGELVWDVGGLVTGVGGIAKGSVKLASVGIKLGTDKLEQMAARQVVKNAEWKAGKGEYSVKPGGGYGSPSTVTHNGQAVENAGDFSGSLPKPAGKGETGAGPKESTSGTAKASSEGTDGGKLASDNPGIGVSGGAGPKETLAPVVGGLDLSKVEVLTIKDARKLKGENRGLIFVQEPQGDFSKPFVKFEAGTTGAFSDVLSERKAVPAIRFDNPNPNGNNFVKFDGVEDVDGITLIDRKTALTSFDKQLQSVQRVSNALKQNPGIKAVFEFPSQKAADRAIDILIEQNIRNITVRVAP